MPVSNPYGKTGLRDSTRVTGVQSGVSRVQGQGLGQTLGVLGGVTKSIGRGVQSLLRQIKDTSDKNMTADVNEAGSEVDAAMSQWHVQAAVEPSPEQINDFIKSTKAYRKRLTLKTMQKYGGNLEQNNLRSKLLATRINKTLTKYDPQSLALWKQFSLNNNNKATGKLLSSIFNDTTKNPDSYTENLIKGEAIILGFDDQRPGGFGAGTNTRFFKNLGQAQKRELTDYLEKERSKGPNALIDGIYFYAKRKNPNLTLKEQTDFVETTRHWFYKQKKLKEFAEFNMNRYIDGKVLNGSQNSYAFELKGEIETAIQDANNLNNPNKAMQELSKSGAVWKIKLQQHKEILKNDFLERTAERGDLFDQKYISNGLLSIDKKIDQLEQTMNAKVLNYTNFHNKTREQVYENTISSIENPPAATSTDDYVNKANSIGFYKKSFMEAEEISKKNMQAFEAQGEKITMGIDGATLNNDSLGIKEVANVKQEIGLGMIQYDQAGGGFSIAPEAIRRITKSGIFSENDVQQILNTPALSQPHLMRLMKNKPEDRAINQEILKSVNVIRMPDGNVTTQYKDFSMAAINSGKHKYKYKMYLQDRSGFASLSGKTDQMRKEAYYSRMIENAAGNSVAMDMLPHNLKKSLRNGQITQEQAEKGTRYHRNNWGPGIPVTIRRIFERDLKSLHKIIKNMSGDTSPAGSIDAWLANLTPNQQKLIGEVENYTKSMIIQWNKNSKALAEKGMSVEKKVFDMMLRLKTEATKGSINLIQGGKNKWKAIPKRAIPSPKIYDSRKTSSLSDTALIQEWNKIKRSNSVDNAELRYMVQLELLKRKSEKWQKTV